MNSAIIEDCPDENVREIKSESEASSQSIPQSSISDIIIEKFDENGVSESETIDITPEKSGGVLKRIVKEGDGEEFPSYGDRVQVHYTGWLLVKEPKVFDSTRDDGKSVEFNLGRGMVIKGWDLGISTMKKGEVSLFIVHPRYAYGNMGYLPAIPPNTPLLFEIELIGWLLEDLSPQKDNTICRKVLEKGEGCATPNDGAYMKVKLIRYDEDDVLEEEKEFTLGEGCYANIPEGIEVALQKFHLKERSEIILKSKYASDNKNIERPKVEESNPEWEKKYEVTLLDFKKAKDVWEMNSDEKFERASFAKEKGISFFQDGNYKIALKQFKTIVTCLENEPGVSPDSQGSRRSLLLSGYLNIGLCYMKLGNYTDAIKVCDKAITIDPENEKALFRRGQAKLELNDCEEALQDFNFLIKIKPDNKAAQNYITLCQRKWNEQKNKDKTTYNKMFEIFKERDAERLRNMKTETGVWENEKDENGESIANNEDLIHVSSSSLLDANVIEISNTVNEKIYIGESI